MVANPMWNQDFNRDIFENDPFDRFPRRRRRHHGQERLGMAPAHPDLPERAADVRRLCWTRARARAAPVPGHEDRERNIRRWFVERDLIDGVILLPDNLFYNTSAAGVIVVLSKRKPEARRGKITLVNASRRVGKGRPKNFIPENDISAIAALFLKGEPVEGEVAVITREQATEADYNLSPSRWVGQADAVEQRSISEIIADMRRLDEEAHEVDASLARMLERLQ